MDAKIYDCCKEITKKTASLELKEKLSKFREIVDKQREEIVKLSINDDNAKECNNDLDQLVDASTCLLFVINCIEAIAFSR